MKKLKLLFFILIALTTACSDDEAIPETGDDRDKIVNLWNCSGNDAIFGKQTFKSNIKKDVLTDDRIKISNFHGFQGEDIYAVLSDKTLTIPEQLSGGWKIAGEGTIDDGYNDIDWTYTIDEGDGKKHSATAHYTTRAIAVIEITAQRK